MKNLRARFMCRVWIYILIAMGLLFLDVIFLFIYDFVLRIPVWVSTLQGVAWIFLIVYIFLAVYMNMAPFCSKKVTAKILRYESALENCNSGDAQPSTVMYNTLWDVEYEYNGRTYRRLFKAAYDFENKKRNKEDTIDILVCPFLPKLVRVPKESLDAKFVDRK